MSQKSSRNKEKLMICFEGFALKNPQLLSQFSSFEPKRPLSKEIFFVQFSSENLLLFDHR